MEDSSFYCQGEFQLAMGLLQMVLRSVCNMKWETGLFVSKGEFWLAMALHEKGAVVSIQNEKGDRSFSCEGRISDVSGFA